MRPTKLPRSRISTEVRSVIKGESWLKYIEKLAFLKGRLAKTPKVEVPLASRFLSTLCPNPDQALSADSSCWTKLDQDRIKTNIQQLGYRTPIPHENTTN
ncbi:hypothetical protein JHK85_019457 [Glycine max]|nr:hypothetical protein JHK85_019457 [Glycine max]